ncbi:MAG: clostripain-related cysteine peptidase [Paenibacillus sp.]|nr:clostripain-related cysteine peptidase [Paenibacillus sp.]
MNHSYLTRIMMSLMAMFILVSCSDDDDPEPQGPVAEVSRTVLVYMIADNSLASDWGSDDEDISEMLKGAKNGGLNGGRLLVYHNRLGTTKGNVPEMLEITANGLKTLKQYPDDRTVYSVDPERIREVMADMKALAPAEDYGLVLWSHANGWLGAPAGSEDYYRSFGDDRGYHITIPSLARALEDEEFSFLYLDCCLMGNIECIYELRNVAPRIVASPTELHVDGMPYDLNVPLMFRETPDVDGMARNTFGYYDNYNGNKPFSPWCQIAAYDTSELEAFAQATRDILATVTEYKPIPTDLQRYTKPRETCHTADIDGYMALIAGDSNPELLKAWREALGRVVTYKESTTNSIGTLTIDLDKYNGLGIYPIASPSEASWRQYYNLAWWKDVASTAPAAKQ